MSILKNMLRKFIGKFGYKLHRSSEQRVHFNNFSNLTQAYEQRLNEVNNIAIETNDIRPKLLARLLGTPPSEAYFIVHALPNVEWLMVNGDVC
ncbi:MAG: hypothetical protein KAH18_07360 [Psychromonas sp.]|nr:hypothetical protein [Psychromonas sp.]